MTMNTQMIQAIAAALQVVERDRLVGLANQVLYSSFARDRCRGLAVDMRILIRDLEAGRYPGEIELGWWRYEAGRVGGAMWMSGTQLAVAMLTLVDLLQPAIPKPAKPVKVRRHPAIRPAVEEQADGKP